MSNLLKIRREQIEQKKQSLDVCFSKKRRLKPYWHEQFLFELGYELYRRLNLHKSKEWQKERYWKYFKHRWELHNLSLNLTEIEPYIDEKIKWVDSGEFIQQVCYFINCEFK